jgi:hypothetical protein
MKTLITALFLTSICRCWAVNLDFVGGGTIKSNITINVPADYPSLQAAFTALSDKSVVDSATITIQIADGTYTSTSALTPPRTVGANIRVIGDVANPAAVVLSFTNGTNGFWLTNNQTLGYVNGVTLDGISRTTNSAGFYLYKSCSVEIGSAVVIKGFNYGIASQLGSSVLCPGITVTGNTCGMAVNCSATIFAANVNANNNVSNGFYANYCGNITAFGSTATGCPYPYMAESGGTVLH